MEREYYRALYRGNQLRWVGVMFFTLLAAPSGLVVSWLLGEAFDVMATGDMAWLLQLMVIGAVWLGADVLVNLIRSRLRTRFYCKALTQYKDHAFSRLSEKSISAFSRENTGRYISVLTNDVESVEKNYLSSVFDIVYYSLMIAGSAVMMFYYSVKLALISILIAAVAVVASSLMGGEMANREKAVSDRNEGFVSLVKDLLAGFSVIKAFKAETEAKQLFEKNNDTVEKTKFLRRWWECLVGTVQGVCAGGLQFGIIFYGGYLAIQGEITAGTALIMVNLVNFLVQPLNVIPQSIANRKAAKALISKLAEVTSQNASRSGEVIEPVLRDAITMEKLSFGYEEEKPVLKDIDLRLEAGKKYAIVGASGSGKSTLLNLLMGAYDGYSGSIAVDGKELKGIDPDSLYDLVSLIGQNVFLFDDTIRQNITMFRQFPDNAVESAVERSGLAAVIAAKGENYRCGENGNGLSGGERQRVSIARSLLRGSPVLMLDEATAALDNQTAFEVTDAILNLEGLTRIVVTHRLEEALLRQYDQIIVLRDGRITERGTYESLMAMTGYFYSLYNVTNG